MMGSGEDQISSVHLFSISIPTVDMYLHVYYKDPEEVFSRFFAYLKDKMGIKFYIYEFSVYKTDFYL